MTEITDQFVSNMEELWITKLGNVSSPAFRAMWKRMAETFLNATRQGLQDNGLAIGPAWQVLAPEMGVGKTVGALLYLGMMGRNALALPKPLKVTSRDVTHALNSMVHQKGRAKS